MNIFLLAEAAKITGKAGGKNPFEDLAKIVGLMFLIPIVFCLIVLLISLAI